MSVESSMLRIATLAIMCTWPLWLLFTLAPGFGVDGGLVVGDGATDSTGATDRNWIAGNWYVITTALIFASAEVVLVAAWLCGTRRALIAGLRYAGATVVVALLILVGAAVTHTHIDTGQDSGNPGLWFAGFCALPATAFALTVSMRTAFLFAGTTVGTTAVANTITGGFTDPVQFIAYVGYSVILGQYFAQFAAAALRIGRTVDRTEETARRNSVRAARLRARTAEMTKFTALVHDNVLSNLSAVARGDKPEILPDLSLTSLFEGRPEVTPQAFAEAATLAVTSTTPDCTIDLTVSGDATPVPTVVASPMVLALSELARNSGRHAGEAAGRHCDISIGAASVTLTYRDTGHGFDPGEVRHTAAGLRISVYGRMDGVDGGNADITSSPGDGTTGTLTWDGDCLPDLPEDDGPDAPVANIMARSDLEGTLSMNRLFFHVSTVIHAGLFIAMAAANGPLAAPATLVTLGLILTALVLLVYGEISPLQECRARIVAVCLVSAVITGLWQHPDGPEGWLRGWHLAAVALLAAMMAVVRRPWYALGTVAVGAAALQILSATDIPGTTDDVTGLSLIGPSLIVVAAVIVNFGLYSFVWRVPAAQERLRRSVEEETVAEESAQQRAQNLRLLEVTVGPVFTAVHGAGQISPALAQRAHLTELGLRDMIRSPLLNAPELRDAVRDARLRGVTVLLLDDHTGRRDTGQGNEVDQDVEKSVELLLGTFVEAVDRTSTGRVTIRLLPPGRTAFATVTDADGSQRFAADGTTITG
ncbi:hypothetical protein [Corynebacterium variabile]|uniref:hypothetical protein n=1 Tax=Corynebacterium variabile TaxID=1727 RepID=UPI0028A5D599|nr:hypothetical protein [Corynebacterium variabile]